MINNGYADEMIKLATVRHEAIKRLMRMKDTRIAVEKAILEAKFLTDSARIGGVESPVHKHLDPPTFLRRK